MWRRFSDYELPKIYDAINSNFKIIPNLSIIHFNSLVEIKDILKRCFKEENSIRNEYNILNNNINENIIKIENIYLKLILLIFISNRLGITNVSSDYYPSLKNIFNCNEYIGFIRGKNNSNSCFIFF